MKLRGTSCPFLVEGPNGMSHWYNDGALVVWRLKNWQCFEGMQEDVESFRRCKMFVPEGLGKG